MSDLVKCDICDKIFNQSYLSSHKRLAHGKPVTPAYCAASEDEAVEVIAALFARLSDKRKREVRDRVSAAASITR
jgi:hypothetical protein